MLKLLTQKVCVFKHVAEDQGFIINTDSLSLNVYNTTSTREVHDKKHSQNSYMTLLQRQIVDGTFLVLPCLRHFLSSQFA